MFVDERGGDEGGDAFDDGITTVQTDGHQVTVHSWWRKTLARTVKNRSLPVQSSSLACSTSEERMKQGSKE